VRLHTMTHVKGQTTQTTASDALAAVGIDSAAVIERLGGDAELLAEVSAIFVSDFPRIVGSLESARDARDAQALARAAHAIAGAVGNFTEGGVYLTTRTVERLAHDGNVDGALEAVPGLLQELEQVREALAGVASV
jgi:HPt (histidine-containing phosphotransfer) domain-containing protein